MSNEQQIKVILLGNSGVGKTSLINAIIHLDYKYKDISSTLASYYVQKPISYNGENYLLNIWDTAGQETYVDVTKLFFKGSEIIIFVYDICSSNSFKDLEKWIDMAEDIIENKHICSIVGNKNDLYLNAKITEDEAKKLADDKNYKFKLVSAKDDPKGVNDFLATLVKEYKDKIGENTGRERRKSIKLKDMKKSDNIKERNQIGRASCRERV